MNGIWIRSQYKSALAFVTILDSTFLGEIYAKQSFGDIDGDSELLGKYDTEARALEVLDAIQHQLQCFIGYQDNANYAVYQMPAD